MEEVFVALGHFFLALGTFAAAEIGHVWLLMKMGERSEARFLYEARGRIDLPWEEDNFDEIQKQLTCLEHERYSHELFRNRLADLIGTFVFAANIFRSLVLLAVVVFAAWHTILTNLSSAAMVWWVVPIEIVFIVFSISMGWLCQLITGRLPNEPKTARRRFVNNPLANESRKSQEARL